MEALELGALLSFWTNVQFQTGRRRASVYAAVQTAYPRLRSVLMIQMPMKPFAPDTRIVASAGIEGDEIQNNREKCMLHKHGETLLCARKPRVLTLLTILVNLLHTWTEVYSDAYSSRLSTKRCVSAEEKHGFATTPMTVSHAPLRFESLDGKVRVRGGIIHCALMPASTAPGLFE
ncbi:hypothetical protein K439DRAFT_1624437 [Ramaria rubella]|nr:hypothetical protein K439DRAFT_1624437 [Ramaria rubella]